MDAPHCCRTSLLGWLGLAYCYPSTVILVKWTHLKQSNKTPWTHFKYRGNTLIYIYNVIWLYSWPLYPLWGPRRTDSILTACRWSKVQLETPPGLYVSILGLRTKKMLELEWRIDSKWMIHSRDGWAIEIRRIIPSVFLQSGSDAAARSTFIYHNRWTFLNLALNGENCFPCRGEQIPTSILLHNNIKHWFKGLLFQKQAAGVSVRRCNGNKHTL